MANQQHPNLCTMRVCSAGPPACFPPRPHRNSPNDSCSELAASQDELFEGRPNTYTYTKAIAEHCVARNEGKYPITIVRPSIVLSAFKDPHPGWVDNLNGLVGVGLLASIGVLRTIDWNYYATSDMVPVDYVANCIICAAQKVSAGSPKNVVVHNMTSGNMQPISWGVYFDKLRAISVQAPTTKVVRPPIVPPKYKRANPISFCLTQFFSELLFAYTIDALLVLLGYKKILLKITRKLHHAYEILRPFTITEWIFHSDNVIAMSESLEPKDREMFQFDMRNFDWEEQARSSWFGARQFLLKEKPTDQSIAQGRTRLRIVSGVHYICQTIMLASSAYVCYFFLAS